MTAWITFSRMSSRIVSTFTRLLCWAEMMTASTRTVTYEVTLKERGYGPEPYAIADALMYADGKPVVDITDMCVRLSGSSGEQVAALWQAARYSRVCRVFAPLYRQTTVAGLTQRGVVNNRATPTSARRGAPTCAGTTAAAGS